MLKSGCMFYYEDKKSEIKQVCNYLIGKIDNSFHNCIEINDYQICVSHGKTNGALIVNFDIIGDKDGSKTTATPFK